MFNSEFYPTPQGVLEQMGIDCYNKVVLEPSAGKGDIVDYLLANGSSQILACENNQDLAKIVATKCQLITHDFFDLTSEQISHINLIVMNPPFSSADKHILHAWEIAPEGCEIIALCNWETINKSYCYSRSELKTLIENYGDCQNLANCFSTAERKTDVEVGLVRLFKPVLSADFDWDGFYYGEANRHAKKSKGKQIKTAYNQRLKRFFYGTSFLIFCPFLPTFVPGLSHFFVLSRSENQRERLLHLFTLNYS